MRLQPYDAVIKYSSGESNPADYLSRNPSFFKHVCSREEKVAEEYVNYLSDHCIPKAMSISEVKEATKRDKTMQAVMSALQDSKWYLHKEEADVDRNLFSSFQRVKEELSASSEKDLLLRGSRVVIPSTLHKKAVSLAHEDTRV